MQAERLNESIASFWTMESNESNRIESNRIESNQIERMESNESNRTNRMESNEIKRIESNGFERIDILLSIVDRLRLFDLLVLSI